VSRIFHDHECANYDERFAIVHDERSARRALHEVEDLLESATERGAGAGRSISRVCPNGPMSSWMVGGARDFRIRRTGPSACCTAIGHVG
jgi:hypothetical protein